ncbi:MAG: acyltransferase [Acidimicrobiia bacterium]|nr:acyltransferase [Acidimicrobiia bacterium]
MTRRDILGDLVADAHEWVRRRAAIGPNSRRGRVFAAFGPQSIICFPPAALFGEAGIQIGSEVMIGPNVSLSAGMAPGQSLVSNRIVVIGDRCLIGRNSSIVGHLSIEIGPDVYFGPNVYVTDQNHSADDPNLPIGHQSAAERPVRIGAGSWIGTNAVILPGVTIGRQAIVGAGAVVVDDIPDGAVAVGSPARLTSRVRGDNA